MQGYGTSGKHSDAARSVSRCAGRRPADDVLRAAVFLVTEIPPDELRGFLQVMPAVITTMKARTYTVLLIPNELGGYSVEVPALPGCFSQGKTRAEALANAQEAVRLHVRAMEADGEPVPEETERPSLELVTI